MHVGSGGVLRVSLTSQDDTASVENASAQHTHGIQGLQNIDTSIIARDAAHTFFFISL